MIKRAYYLMKPMLPRNTQLFLRRMVVRCKRINHAEVWPIDKSAGKCPARWPGWPDGKKFALVLTHDVDTEKGHDKCLQLMELEQKLGFRSSFNFVPLRYNVSSGLRANLSAGGFEVGVHGLYHDGKYYHSRKIFRERAVVINRYLKEWGAVGFRTPSMLHNLEWLHDLDIEYDASTFDTDPFEPQSDGVGTIFPFLLQGNNDARGYVELPYTLPQDFTVFILFRERNIDLWKRKLDWIAQKGGMALVNTHPDYMRFGPGKPGHEEYPSGLYEEFLEHVRDRYAGQYWHALPRDLAGFWRRYSATGKKPGGPELPAGPAQLPTTTASEITP